MDNEILVGESLTREMVGVGHDMLVALNKELAGNPQLRSIAIGYWLKELVDDEIRWTLVFAIPGLSFHGPGELYDILNQLLQKMHDEKTLKLISLERIALVDTNNPTTQAIRDSLWQIAPPSDSRYTGKLLAGRNFHDLYILHMEPEIRLSITFPNTKKYPLNGRRQHVFVRAGDLDHRRTYTIIGHGWRESDSEDSIRVEIPAVFESKLESGDWWCQEFFPTEITGPWGDRHLVFGHILVREGSFTGSVSTG